MRAPLVLVEDAGIDFATADAFYTRKGSAV
jgi:hypothetical protein